MRASIACPRVSARSTEFGSGSPAASLPVDGFSARWTGTVTSPATAAYTFSATSDDGSRIYLDDKLIADNWGDHGVSAVKSAPVQLTAGQPHTLRVEYYENAGDASVSIGWSAPGVPDPSIAAAAADILDSFHVLGRELVAEKVLQLAPLTVFHGSVCVDSLSWKAI